MSRPNNKRQAHCILLSRLEKIPSRLPRFIIKRIFMTSDSGVRLDFAHNVYIFQMIVLNL